MNREFSKSIYLGAVLQARVLTGNLAAVNRIKKKSLYSLFDQTVQGFSFINIKKIR